MQWSIYPYAVKYLSLLLPIIVVKYSFLCSEVFIHMQWSIYPYVTSRRMKYLLKKEVVSIYCSGPSAGILGISAFNTFSYLFILMQWSIYPYVVKYLSICSKVFTPMWRLEEGSIY